MTHRIAVIAGDGVGPEVVAEARKAVDSLGLDLTWHELPWGTDHYHRHGAMMPPDALEIVRGTTRCCSARSATRRCPTTSPCGGCCCRSVRGSTSGRTCGRRASSTACRRLDGRRRSTCLRAREHRGRVLGRRRPRAPGLELEVGIETSVFTRAGVKRVVAYAFELAAERRGVVTSATKSNASRYGYVLWDEVAEEVSAEHPDVVLERVLVDALAARMVEPASLDVVVASISSATCSPTSPRCSRAGWGWRRARASRRVGHSAASSSRCTAPRPISPARGSRTRWAPSGAPS